MAEPLKEFVRATYEYATKIASIVGVQNTFATLLIVGALLYYMLKGGLAENWWKILIIIIFALLISRI